LSNQGITIIKLRSDEIKQTSAEEINEEEFSLSILSIFIFDQFVEINIKKVENNNKL